jgi:hypothetical protein
MARENQKHLNLYIPNDLYTRVAQTGLTITTAVILGLEKLLDNSEDINTQPKENKTNSELVISQQARIESLEEQLKVKDTQIEKLTDTMQAQAVQVQTMIQQRAIEAPGAKKPWWRFW